jgi:hypothetical protein
MLGTPRLQHEGLIQPLNRSKYDTIYCEDWDCPNLTCSSGHARREQRYIQNATLGGDWGARHGTVQHIQ